MRILLLSLLLVLYTSISFADQPAEASNTCSQPQSSELFDNQVAQRGCCSYHGGVCGCSGGRAQCCDGTLSPSCGCHADDLKSFELYESEKPKS